MSEKVEVLLFDLGGVLVDFGGAEGLAALLPAPVPTAEIEARWQRCPHSLAFGSGALDVDAFADAFMRDWQIGVARDAFLAEYRSWARGFLPGARELLEELRPRYRLAALSNSNPLHWARLVEECGLSSAFEVALSSHEVGYRKPAREMYEAALARLDVAPGAVLFLDDSPANVEAAAAMGMQAAVAVGVDGVRRVLGVRSRN